MRKNLIKFITNNWLTIVLAIIPPIMIYYFIQRETKELSITINSQTSVFNLNEKYSDDIKILFKDKAVKTLDVLHISVENTGSQPIKASDYSSPLIFEFESKTQISFNSIQSFPANLNPQLSSKTDSLYVLEPILLNPKDKFTFLAFLIDLENSNSPLKIEARIVGISQPTLEYPLTEETINWGLSWGQKTGMTLALIISLLSSFDIFRKLKETLVTTTTTGEINIKLVDISQKKEVKSLAHRLKIEGHDTKSNLLLVRIKLEEQLRELASNLDLPEKKRLSSPYLLSKSLQVQRIINSKQGNGIREVLRIINRELHISESYLNHTDYKNLQIQSLRLLDELIALNETTTIN